jgi:hypothetical protein
MNQSWGEHGPLECLVEVRFAFLTLVAVPVVRFGELDASVRDIQLVSRGLRARQRSHTEDLFDQLTGRFPSRVRQRRRVRRVERLVVDQLDFVLHLTRLQRSVFVRSHRATSNHQIADVRLAVAIANYQGRIAPIERTNDPLLILAPSTERVADP